MSTASMPEIISIAPFQGTGVLIKTTFQLFGKHFGKWLGITLRVLGLILVLNLISLLVSLLPLVLTADANTAGPVNLGISVVTSCVLLLVLIAYIFVPWMNGALIYQTLEQVNWRAAGVSDSYRATQPRFGGLWLNTFLSQAVHVLLLLPLFVGVYGGIFWGLLNAKLIPGLSANFGSSSAITVFASIAAICTPLGVIGAIISLIISMSWSASLPAIVGEGADGFGAFSRSAKLTKGMRFRLLGRYIAFGFVNMLIFGLPVWILLIVAGIPLFSAGITTPLPPFTVIMLGVIQVVAGIFGLFQAALAMIFSSLNYLDLRAREELAALPEPERAQRMTVAATKTIAAPAAVMTMATVLPSNSASAIPVFSAPVVASYASSSSPNATTAIVSNMTPAQKIGVYFNRLRNEGPNSQLLSEMGASYFEVGDLGAALDAYSRARDLSPRDPDIAYSLMRVHVSRKDSSAARDMMSEYLDLETNDEDKQKVLSNPSYKPFLP